jgi:AraC-like DNA-binding protein
VDRPYRLRTLAPAEVRSLYFSPSTPVRAEVGPIDVRPLLRELILDACSRGPLLASRSDHAALAELIRHEVEAAPPLPTGLPWPRTVWLREFAERAMGGSGRVDALIEASGYSRRTLERAMREETALSLGRWLRQARMLRSIARLGEGATVAEAALASGYSEPSAYIHAFRKAFSITPGRALGESGSGL